MSTHKWHLPLPLDQMRRMSSCSDLHCRDPMCPFSKSCVRYITAASTPVMLSSHFVQVQQVFSHMCLSVCCTHAGPGFTARDGSRGQNSSW